VPARLIETVDRLESVDNVCAAMNSL